MDFVHDPEGFSKDFPNVGVPFLGDHACGLGELPDVLQGLQDRDPELMGGLLVELGNVAQFLIQCIESFSGPADWEPLHHLDSL